jgi:hypothetical protein
MMRKYFRWIPALLTLLTAMALALPAPAAPVSEPQDLLQQLEELENTYLRYTIRAERIKADKASLEEYFLLLDDIQALEKKIEVLEDILAQAADDQDMALPGFEIKGFLDRAGGDPIRPYASNGDIVAFSAEVEHPAFEGDGKPSEIFFQLYDGNDQPVAGVLKRHKALEAGTRKTYTFRFSLDKMAQGKYRVGATHYLLENPDVKTQASATFKVFDAAVLDGIVVTDRPNGTPHQNFITNDKLPHIYVYYKLAEGVQSADANITVIDAKTDETIVSMQATRPLEKQYFGIRLQKDSFKKEQRFKVQASVTTPDGRTKTAISSFSVGYYQLGLTIPGYIKSGDTVRFNIRPPKEFESPMTVDLNPSRALVLHHGNNALSGTVTGVGRESDVRAELGIVIKDANNKIARNTFLVSVGAKPKPKPVVSSSGPSGSGASGKASSSGCKDPGHQIDPSKLYVMAVKHPPLDCAEVEWKRNKTGGKVTEVKYQVKKGTNIEHGQYIRRGIVNGREILLEEIWFWNGEYHGPAYHYGRYDLNSTTGPVGPTSAREYKNGDVIKIWYFENGKMIRKK